MKMCHLVTGCMTLVLILGLLPTLPPTYGQEITEGVKESKFPPWPQNRLRSFYRDQARRYLRSKQPLPELLPSFPGLDGGTFGHWGQGGEKYIIDDAFNRVDFGGMISAVTNHFGTTTLKAVNIQLGQEGNLSAIFDPTKRTFTDVWAGPLVRFESFMLGLISPVKPRGEQRLNLQGSRWNLVEGTPRQYRGLYRHGREVVFRYQLGDAEVFDHAWKVENQFARTLQIQGSLAKDTTLTLLETDADDVKVTTLAGLPVVTFRQGKALQIIALRCRAPQVRLRLAQPSPFALFGKPKVRLEFGGTQIRGPIHLAFLQVRPNQAEAAVKAFAAVEVPNLDRLMQGGKARWAEKAVKTQGVLGDTVGAYAIDTLTLPYDEQNGFGLRFRVGGVDFLPDGRAAVATLGGDVWLLSGVDDDLNELVWRRVAAGLHQPLGLLVQEGKILVIGRDQITRLHDLNGDDEMDYYECLTNQYETRGGHEFVTCLRQDDQGNLYFSSAAEGIMQYDPRTQKLTTLGTGIRYCNGVGVSPDGQVVLATAQEGTWTPATAIFEVGDGSYHGFFGPRKQVGEYGYDLPLCFVPRGIDHSAGAVGRLPEDERLGPLAGHFVGLSLGNCTHYLVLREQVGDRVQGGIVPLPGEFLSGAHRIRFNPHDGHVYVGGSSGWQSYAQEHGSLQRLRYTGKPLDLPAAVQTHANGLLIRFNSRIDPTSVKRSNVFCEQWNYLYSPGYGSSEYSARDPGRAGHDPVEVRGVHLLDDGQSVFVELPQLHPVMQLHLYLQLRAIDPADNAPRVFTPDLYYTVYQMREPFRGFPGYQAVAKRPAPAFPVMRAFERDRRLVAQENRGRTGAVSLVSRKIRARPGLRYEPNVIRVPPRRRVALTFRNDDISMSHNLVLVRPDRLNPVGEQSMIMAADPRALAKHYVPDDPGVLALAPVLNPGGQYTVYFDAPGASGIYPIVCTFPGHWRVMRASLVVARPGEELDVPQANATERKFVKMWMTADLAADANNLAKHSVDKGRLVFESAGCMKCHAVAGKGAKLGPDLSDVWKRYTGGKLLEQILNPSSEIHQDYQTEVFITSSGKTVTGLVVKEQADTVQILTNPLEPERLTRLQTSEIEERFKSKVSTMPKGLLMTYRKEEILDLLAYLQSGKPAEK